MPSGLWTREEPERGRRHTKVERWVGEQMHPAGGGLD
jgi:hypothetical protein